MAAYEAAGGKQTDGIAYGKLLLSIADSNNVFATALQFLKDYPNADPKKLLRALNTATSAINATQPGQIRELYQAITTILLRQPSDDAHVQMVAQILNEKKKLELIMPELKQ